MRKALSCLILAALLAVAAGTAEIPPLSCPEIQGLDPLLRPGQVLLLGEMHGTVQSPAFVADAACRALHLGRPVTVALEIPREEEPRFAAFLASEGKPADRDSLLAGPFWQDPYQDGRRSEAMLALIETLRRYRREGRPLQVVLLDKTKFASPQERDQAMADALLARIGAAKDDVVLALTGNVHNRTVRGTPWNKDFEPMGALVVKRHPGVVALDVSYPGGSAWICTGAKPEDCGAREVSGRGDGKPRVVLRDGGADEKGHHGRYEVEALTASPPAVKGPERPAGSGQPPGKSPAPVTIPSR